MLFTSILVAVLPLSTLAYPAPAPASGRFTISRRQQNATEDNPDLQNSLTLSQSVIATGFENDGQSTPEPGQVPSITSSNNFINYCATVPQLPITNGKQITTGSCNPAPMGQIPSTANMVSAKFVFPPNMGTIPANTNFTIKLAIQGMQTGFFVNAQQNYFGAPQQLNDQGQIQGHSHVVIEALDSITQTTPTDPTKFAFFKGLNSAAEGGILSTVASLPAGVYKITSINTAANHQPVAMPVAQHGSTDDCVYFTVTDNGSAPAAGAGDAAPGASPPAGAATTTTAAAAAATTTAAAAGAGGASTTPAHGGPAFDPAGTKNVGNGKGGQFIGGQCLSAADCASGCCAGPSGICSGVGAQTQNGKTGCGFSSTAPANGQSPASGANNAASPTNQENAAMPSKATGAQGSQKKGGKQGGRGGKKGRRFELLKY